MTPKRAIQLWAALLIVSLSLLALRWPPHLETSFLKLLPQPETQRQSLEHLQDFDQKLSKKLMFVFSHPDRLEALKAVAEFRYQLQNNPLFENIDPPYNEARGKSLFDNFFHLRYNLLAPQSEPSSEGHLTLLQQQRETIYSGFSPLIAFEQDPLLVFQSLLESWTLNRDHFSIDEGVLCFNDGVSCFYLLSAETRTTPFSRSASNQAVAALTQMTTKLLNTYQKLNLQHTGVLFFAQRESEKIESDIAKISALSFAIISLLLGFIFASLKPLLLSLLAVLSGLFTAFVTTLACFGEIHLVTIGFGSTLIGIAVDYAFHYLVGLHQSETEKKLLVRSILLGLVTSVLGFSVFLIAPLMVLKQMAIFITAGLFAAFCFVVIFFTHATFRHQQHPRYLWLGDRFTAFLNLLSRFRPYGLTLGLLIILATLFIIQQGLQFNDDLRSLGSPELQMLEKDKWIRSLRGELDPNRSIVIKANSVEELLQKEEQVVQSLYELPHLPEHKPQHLCLSQTLPSMKRQQETKQSWSNFFDRHRKDLLIYLNELGFDPLQWNIQKEQISDSEALDYQTWSASPLANASKHLLNLRGKEYCSLVLFSGLPIPAVRQVCQNIKDVEYIDCVEVYSKSLTDFRTSTLNWLAVVYLLVLFFLCTYFGIHNGLMIIFSPTLGVLLSFVILDFYLEAGLNLFHCLAALLVWGIGMDYSILLHQHGQKGGHVLLANACSALTTICSFGFLASSQSPVLNAFGSTIVIGIIISFLSSSIFFAKPLSLD